MFNYLNAQDIINDNSNEIAVEKYIEMHNSTKKFSTLYSPNEIRDITDVNLINKIQYNIIKKQKFIKLRKVK